MGNPNQYPGRETQNEKDNETRPEVKPDWNKQQQQQNVAQALGNLAVKNTTNR